VAEVDRHIRRCSTGAGATSRSSCCCRGRSPARRRARCSTTCARASRASATSYDPTSLASLREANRRCHGAAVVPHYRFDRRASSSRWRRTSWDVAGAGRVRAAVGAAPQRRGDRGFHVQCESGVSVTGSNADLRLAVAPSELGTVAVALLAAVARRR
jgi:molybdopterin-containing oxidoreductase family iron-sulfur binding subunit